MVNKDYQYSIVQLGVFFYIDRSRLISSL